MHDAGGIPQLQLEVWRELKELNLEGLEVDKPFFCFLGVQNGNESAMNPRMMAGHAVCKQSQLLNELLLHQDRVQVRVGRHHRLQEGAMAAAVKE